MLYRRGGRSYRIECAGTFATKRDAENRQKVVAGWLAAGSDPVQELAKLQNPAPRQTFQTARTAYVASRIDVAPSSQEAYRVAGEFWGRALDKRYIDDIDEDDIQRVIGAAKVSLRTLRAYRMPLRGIFDAA